MPFCTSCGAEIAADKKFCGQCGAPVEQPGISVPPSAPEVPAIPPSLVTVPPVQPRKSTMPLVIGSIVVVLLILAAAYWAGMPVLDTVLGSSGGFVPSPSPSETPTMVTTALPTPPLTTAVPVTTTPIQIRDERLEEDYEQIYTLNQKFSFGQKVNFDHDLIRPPLYIRFNLTPVMITRHRLVSIGTNNEHYENTTETSPLAWFEVTVKDAGTGAVIEQRGFGNDYTDITKQNFMVRQKGDYRIEMSGNDVFADIQMLIGTP